MVIGGGEDADEKGIGLDNGYNELSKGVLIYEVLAASCVICIATA